MKEYYDLYYFATYKWNDLDIITLKLAIRQLLNTEIHKNI